MRKILLTSILSLYTMFLFTGCTLKYDINFEEKYVENESVKYISNKIENKEINIIRDESNIKISKRPTSIIMGKGIELKVENKFIEDTLEESLKQYFKTVNIITEENKENKEIVIKPRLIDFDWEPIWGGQSSIFKIEIKVYKENKEILNKIYTEYYAQTKLLGSFLSNTELGNYLKSKDLFEIYKRKIIPDLAKALKENQ
ncbi:hypothetical protein PT447_10955 [Aliarcobacter butzleri]|uniref:hypothetical protein n=1 Tax=Aliarcobacter butzleri TaxID=28197 RepID=UPI0024DEB23D|nr:hypothetical protein [Aliarcobacter butzleri]MDK2065445.1 hypothetical protein [Aliarcobacter butzleri]